jgi:tyrosyl-tRNA synthetase
MKINTDEQKIAEILTRGVEEAIEKESLIKKLESGKKLRVKFGIDPTGSELHLGHSVPLRKLKQFQDLGHSIILLIGDYTAMIGDPTGRNETRPVLTEDQVKENMKNYLEQASKILDLDKTEVRYNSEWYKNKNANFIMELMGLITVARVLDREDFKKRLDEGSDIHMQEMMYPLFQGYDSVALEVDVEIGGTDQKFNLLMGRKLQKKYDKPVQDIITTPLIEGTDGEKKMSKSYGNYIALLCEAEEMFGKVMSIPDNLIIKYFELTTDLPIEKVEKIKQELLGGANPRDAKMRLAEEIVTMYHSAEDAQKAKEYFVNTFAKKQIPNEINELNPTKNDIITILLEADFVKSTSDARRAIDQGGVKVNEEKVGEYDFEVKTGDVVQKGKRFFVKIV